MSSRKHSKSAQRVQRSKRWRCVEKKSAPDAVAFRRDLAATVVVRGRILERSSL